MQSTASIFESIFKKDIAAPETAGFLSQLAKEHPYFTPAQFFLLQQEKDDKMQAAKTSVLFNNPLWLNWLLTKDELTTEAEISSGSYRIEQAEPTVEETQSIVEVEPMNNETEYKSQEIIDITAASQEIINDTVAEDSEMKVTSENVVPPSKEEELLFQPLYTSDYFASQGIKLSDEIAPTDKLGKQLKSFTDWLKTMKKVHTEKLPTGNEQTDIAIQSLAEKSNSDDTVLTEAMAEVFAMQGKAGKAIEVYQKLSLLNPAKSTFFAAKIEQLKTN